MLNLVRERIKENLSHQKIKVVRDVIQNISYPPFIYSQLAENLVLLLGCQRSGNTLAYLMLNCHPSVQGIDESDSDYRLPNPLQLYSQQKNNSLIALKFPGQTHNLDYFVNYLQKCKIIWAVRNPYVVISSMLRWQQKEGNWIKVYGKGELWQHSFLFPEILELDIDRLDEISLGAYVWKYKERTLQLYQQSNLDVFAFKYEELLERPQVVMSQIVDFIGLEWHDNVLHHEEHYSYQKKYPGGTRGTRALDKSRKQPSLDLTSSEIDLITNICYEEIQPYKYKT